MNPVVDAIAPRRGRPRKFARPSRAVTLTLPKEVIDALTAIDPDLSRAIVRVTQPEMAKRPHPPAELATFGRRAVIVVNPSRTLERRTGVVLIPLSDGRALISFDEPMSIAQLELRIQDAIADSELPRADAEVFEEVGRLLREARRSKGVAVEQRSIIILETRSTRKKLFRLNP
jgi:CRP-like cAMP-binding protein